MVKRTLHKRSFTQCDLSGLPLPAKRFCYLPVIAENGKVQKKGQYANWECVMRAIELHTWPDAAAQSRAVDHVKSWLFGAVPKPADVGLLDHFGGCMDAAEWHNHCVVSRSPVSVVRVLTNGTFETIDMPEACSQGVPTGVKMFDGRELVVFYDTNPDPWEPNPVASELAKMPNLTGPVIMALSFEDTESFMPRHRYVPCTVTDLLRKPLEPPTKDDGASTLAQFRAASKAMAGTFKAYEAERSKYAVAPNTITPGMVMPAPSGAELAAVARLRGLGGGSPRSSAPRAPA
eukprot:scaffold15973_cov137-Isochrysis_galbana.AAC.11